MVKTEKLPEQIHPRDLWLRMDHQTFRKLPRSNGIAFGVCVILASSMVAITKPISVGTLCKSA